MVVAICSRLAGRGNAKEDFRLGSRSLRRIADGAKEAALRAADFTIRFDALTSRSM